MESLRNLFVRHNLKKEYIDSSPQNDEHCIIGKLIIIIILKERDSSPKNDELCIIGKLIISLTPKGR